ncbi:hypothetical protein F2P81_020374 [Scophthalmus maximus]|uniref:Uncharacterized protein n=1 Tax=Scophthalmus maximus TaxID=52904 RepID=A0A6A4RZT8_SCOMX|nr:hypothetical protein F2P81_020374 [Scophthalmus maximus]
MESFDISAGRVKAAPSQVRAPRHRGESDSSAHTGRHGAPHTLLCMGDVTAATMSSLRTCKEPFGECEEPVVDEGMSATSSRSDRIIVRALFRIDISGSMKLILKSQM